MQTCSQDAPHGACTMTRLPLATANTCDIHFVCRFRPASLSPSLPSRCSFSPVALPQQNALQRMKMISVGKSTEKLERGLNRAEDLRNVQSENASLTALVLKVRPATRRGGVRTERLKCATDIFLAHTVWVCFNSFINCLWHFKQMRTMNDWKRTGLRSFYGQRVYQALLEATAVKKSLWETQLQV